METRTDRQSLAVRSTTWLESAASAIQISDQDQEEDDEDDHGDSDATPRRSILANVVCLGFSGPTIKDDTSIAIVDPRHGGIHRYLSGILLRRDLLRPTTTPVDIPIVLVVNHSVSSVNLIIESIVLWRVWIPRVHLWENLLDLFSSMFRDWLVRADIEREGRRIAMIVKSAKCVEMSIRSNDAADGKEEYLVIAVDCAWSNGNHAECSWIPFDQRILCNQH